VITKEEINREVDAFAGSYSSAPIFTLINKLEAERDAYRKVAIYYHNPHCENESAVCVDAEARRILDGAK
jgi:hypothetical protein